MKPKDEFIEYLEEIGSGLGEVAGKRMFGGHGLFVDGKMFAIVADGVLYFKVDDANEGEFEVLDLPRFTYNRKGKAMTLRYRRAPEEAVENSRALKKWAKLGIEASNRAAKKKR